MQRRIRWRRREAPTKFPISFLNRVRTWGLSGKESALFWSSLDYRALCWCFLLSAEGESPHSAPTRATTHQFSRAGHRSHGHAGWIRPSLLLLPSTPLAAEILNKSSPPFSLAQFALCPFSSPPLPFTSQIQNSNNSSIVASSPSSACGLEAVSPHPRTARPSAAKRSCRQRILSAATICQARADPHLTTTSREPPIFTSTFNPSSPSSPFCFTRSHLDSPTQQRWHFDYSPTPTAHGAQGRHRVLATLNHTTRFRSSSWLLPPTTSPRPFNSTSTVDAQLRCVERSPPFTL